MLPAVYYALHLHILILTPPGQIQLYKARLNLIRISKTPKPQNLRSPLKLPVGVTKQK